MSENRAEKTGFAAEASAKMKSKYDPQLSKDLLEWLAEIMNIEINTDGSEDNFREVLANGEILCKLLNTIKEGTIKKFHPSPKMTFKCLDNLNTFLQGLSVVGIPMEEYFQSIDLYEGSNLYAVQICLASIGRKAPKFGLKGFGPREAAANPRNFTEEQLRQGDSIISLQYGTNKGANQSGMSFGKHTRF